VNSGGEPERDDTGLPPVDIEIPDDARELDRDVQAYYREQRAERRRLRQRRLHSRFTRDGIVLPVLACCLILALITGTLLTVFTATSDQNSGFGTGTVRPPASGRPASSSAASGSPSTSPASSPGSTSGSAGSASARNPDVVQTGKPLPADGTLVVQATKLQVPLRALHETMLVLVQPACGCNAALGWLAGIAARNQVRTFLVGTPETIAEVNKLHSRLPANLQRVVPVALDSKSVLAHAYPVKGLTAVMVARPSTAGQSAAYAQNLSAADNSAPLLRALTG
jgi:hypothetical protein